MNGIGLEHPTADRLSAFGLGKLDDEELAKIESHVASCEMCCQRLRSSPPDNLVQLVRGADVRSSLERRLEAGRLPEWLAAHPRYDVERLLGAGGMGDVFKARHRLMQRAVALKVISPKLMYRAAAVERFQREVQAAAQLSHPNIVAAFDAEEAGGNHFLVMEFIEGKSLDRVVAEQGPLSIPRACDFIRQAALGLQHACAHGMVHRDIKPQNLMLTAGGQVKILDFGLARFRSESEPVVESPAATVVPAGTVAEAIPPAPLWTRPAGCDRDQTSAETPSRDATADASRGRIGAAGYEEASRAMEGPSGEPLTGDGSVMGSPGYIAPEQVREAHAADTRSDIYSLGCTLYFLLAGQPPFSGTVAEKLEAHERKSPQPLGQVRPDVPAGLTAVLDRMLAKDPAQRYQKPIQVAEALAPFTAALRRRYWCWIAATSAVLLLASGLVLAQTELGAAMARLALNKGELILETEDPDVQVEVLKDGERVRLLEPKTSTQINLNVGDYEVRLFAGKEGLRLSPDRFTLSRGGKQLVTVHSPNGGPALSSGADEVICWWGHRTGEGVWSVAFSPDSRRALSCGDDGYVRQWDIASRKEKWACPIHERSLRDVAVSPDGRTALVAVYDHTVRVLDMATGKELRRFEGHKAKVHGVSFSRDGRLALSAGGTSDPSQEQDNSVRLWEVATAKEIQRFQGHRGWVRTAVFSPDARYVLSASLDRTLRLWDVRTGEEVHRFLGHEEGILSAVFSPDGRQALSASWDRTIRLWRVATGEELRRFEGHADTVESVVFSSDGCQALSASKDSTLRLWDVATGEQLLEMRGHTGMVHAAALSRDGQYALSGGRDGSVRLWRLPASARSAK
jgi:serine/threonine protein kinase/WD40 repeat protein